MNHNVDKENEQHQYTQMLQEKINIIITISMSGYQPAVITLHCDCVSLRAC